MGRTFLFSLIFLFYVLFFSVALANAQTPTPTGIMPKIAGINCGDAEATDSSLRSCCYPENINMKNHRFPDIICLFPGGLFCIGDVFNKLFENVIENEKVNAFLEWTEQAKKEINPCVNGEPIINGKRVNDPANYSDPNCLCTTVTASSKVLCDRYLAGKGEYNACLECSTKGVWTGIGCINTDLGDFIKEKVMTFGIGLAGLIAFLCIIYAAIMLQTSSGNPERIKKAQEMLTSCILGLMLIIFSVFILRLIGVDILKIPGFNK